MPYCLETGVLFLAVPLARVATLATRALLLQFPGGGPGVMTIQGMPARAVIIAVRGEPPPKSRV